LIAITETTVKCPVCSEEVPEKEINLHLDLRCRGISGPSSSGPRSSQASSTSKRTPTTLDKNEREVVVVPDDSPVRPTKAVASIFGSVGTNKRKKPTEDGGEDVKPDVIAKKPAVQRGNDKVPKKEAVGATQRDDTGNVERKSRINPLIAAQPSVFSFRIST
jgi:putative ATPase